jgi:hypothetical protein
VSGQANGASKSRASFGEKDGLACDRSLARKQERAATWAAILIGVAVVMGIAPNWLVGRGFLEMELHSQQRDFSAFPPWTRQTHSLWFLASHDAVWECAVVALALPPLWFWWWRRSAMAFGAAIGSMLSIAAAAAVVVGASLSRIDGQSARPDLGGTYWTLVAAAILFLVAFAIAPPPRDPESVNALQVRGLVRRHRKTA